jgi:hypothetical protein
VIRTFLKDYELTLNSLYIQHSRWIESVAEITTDITGLRPTHVLRAGHSTARVVGDSATYVGGRAAPQPRERIEEDIPVDRSSRFQLWNFCNCFYLAIFRGIFVNVLILVVEVFR